MKLLRVVFGLLLLKLSGGNCDEVVTYSIPFRPIAQYFQSAGSCDDSPNRIEQGRIGSNENKSFVPR